MDCETRCWLGDVACRSTSWESRYIFTYKKVVHEPVQSIDLFGKHLGKNWFKYTQSHILCCQKQFFIPQKKKNNKKMKNNFGIKLILTEGPTELHSAIRIYIPCPNNASLPLVLYSWLCRFIEKLAKPFLFPMTQRRSHFNLPRTRVTYFTERKQKL